MNKATKILLLLFLSIPNSSGAQQTESAAVFEGQNTLLRPKSYREWVFVGSSLGLSYAQSPGRNESELFHNVYIDPVSYREYMRTGKFREGTVMVLELFGAEAKKEPGLQGSYEKDLRALEMSVKDSRRFEGGWAYFGFSEGGILRLKDLLKIVAFTPPILSSYSDRMSPL